MSRRLPLSTLKPIGDINLTPLMDLTFILLITFIITFPLIEQGIPVNLPQGKAEVLSVDTARTISLDAEGALYLDDLPVRLEELRSQMVSIGRDAPDTSVMVRADEGIDYGSVVKVLKVLHDAKVKRMALVTQEGNGNSR